MAGVADAVSDNAQYTDAHCVICKRSVDPAGPDDMRDIPPADALIFISYGNYGSTLFDSADGSEYLIIIICDTCAAQAAYGGNVLIARKYRPQVTLTRKRWLPGKGVDDDDD